MAKTCRYTMPFTCLSLFETLPPMDLLSIVFTIPDEKVPT